MRQSRQLSWIALAAVAGLLFTGCMSTSVGEAPQAVAALPTQAEVATLPPTSTSAPTSTPTPLPSSTPTATSTSTSTPIPSPTHTPTVTPSPTHPLMIEVMRQQEYPGSELTFVEQIASGSNFDQYIVSYESDGNTIYALLTIPWGETPPTGWPVIVFNHGYIPPEQYNNTQNYIYFIAGFASRGYIVISSDYRGHGDSEGEPIIAYRDPGYTTDVLNALAAVKTLEEADPDRIGMYGHSMGGFITLRSMVISDEIKAGVMWGGVVVSYLDLFELWRPDEDPEEPGPARLRRELLSRYGSLNGSRDFWESISANTYVEDLSGPIQLHHGLADDVVPVEFSQILHEEVLAVGGSTELFLYEGDDHNLSTNYWTVLNRSVEFFDEHVKGADN